MGEGYSQTVLDHFRRPRNVGVLDCPDALGYASNPASGAELDLYLAVNAGRVNRAVFRAEGCTATIAAASIATELLQGRLLDSDQVLTGEEVMEALGGLPPTRRHAARLVEEAVRAAAEDYRARRNRT